MNVARLLAAAAALALAAPAVAQTPPAAQARQEAVTVIHAGTLLAVPGRPPRREASIVIRGRRIAEIRDGYVDVPGARVVDLRDSYVLPGLIDMHVHLVGLDDRFQARLQANQRDYEDEAYTALLNARRTLLAGFTTVRDLGAEPRTITSLRDAINAGQFSGPTIVAAGRGVSVTGGHGGVNGLNRDLTEIMHARATNMCNGAEDCRRAVREQISAGADVIKFAATGGVLSNVAGGLNRQMMPDEMRAIVETAHTFGRRVAAHAHGVDGVNAALEAGVDSIEHGTFTNDQTFALYRRTGAYYVPTLMAPAAALADGARGALTPAQYDKAREAAGNATESLRRAVRENVNIAFGTDSGVSRHGDNAQEFALMVNAGMTPAAAIRAATVGAATLLGRADTIGTIEPGKEADIIAVAGDPTENVRLLETVGFVMHQGRVHKLGGERQLTDAD
ncbi:amidohydrolase family protein [Sphingosinicella sp. LHD-64]|uniref:metal-dependent hydrolase family protein n=1 Tax=Sphingosinicella sp. LHD-64 TaxID=3072139 RepID=UPI002810677F|nr:amidohydrolase family protein [Sphingosinicella sp. LHD-64]MDQ8756042.1 amidohydrolase family protein [Sphingosinicella sp. LHD-64]